MKFQNLTSIVFMVLLIGGCATVNNQPDDQVVKNRAQKWLDAVTDGDFERAYKFASPGYRDGVSLTRFKAKYLGAPNWQNANVKKVTCEESKCQVVISFEYTSNFFKGTLPSHKNDTWILVDSEWWLYP
ncbi:hypothetical protein [Gilvimarinus chinensis]|uniref:hypothetical protein n=1 Tax=Gilvimarinus chinensis TaxID=396005 RepID=UPI00036B68C3|nr:hypothetical protein [Gilvimarinus chinensis]